MRRLTLIAIIGLFGLPMPILPAAEYVTISDDPSMRTHALSADGTTAVGRLELPDVDMDGRGFIWSRQKGLRLLNLFPGTTQNNAHDVSADGSVVVGSQHFADVFTPHEFFLWREQDGLRSIGAPAFNLGVSAGGVSISADGKMVVGSGCTLPPGACCARDVQSEAIRWSEADGVVRLGVPEGMTESRALDISADKKVVLVAAWEASETHPRFGAGLDASFFGHLLWDEQNGFQDVGRLPEAAHGSPIREIGGESPVSPPLSADGSAFISIADAPSADQRASLLWTREEGYTVLPPLEHPVSGRLSSREDADALTADGAIVVGAARFQPNENDTYRGWRGFVWDEHNGTRDLRQVLIEEHDFRTEELPPFLAPRGISADGTALIGSAREIGGARTSWAIYLDKPLVTFDIPGDFNANGTVEQADLDLVLLNWGEDTATLPDTWTSPPATGAIVDQDELDQVLLNWGNTSTAAVTTAAVPEPESAGLLLGGLLGLLLFRRAKR